MVKVYVLQTDNRPTLDYLLQTQKINTAFCNILEYTYIFIELDNNKYGNIHPATKKIYIVNEFLQNTEFDILVFLDSDAWINNGYWLRDVITNLINNDNKNGCFSRDPYIKKNTFINSGSFIIKNNCFIKQMYNKLILELNINKKYHNQWPYDQYYISKYVFENKDAFTIFIPNILNTPIGKVLRHNWFKNKKMYNDLHSLYNDINVNSSSIEKTSFNEKEYYDEKTYPNIL